MQDYILYLETTKHITIHCKCIKVNSRSASGLCCGSGERIGLRGFSLYSLHVHFLLCWRTQSINEMLTPLIPSQLKLSSTPLRFCSSCCCFKGLFQHWEALLLGVTCSPLWLLVPKGIFVLLSSLVGEEDHNLPLFSQFHLNKQFLFLHFWLQVRKLVPAVLCWFHHIIISRCEQLCVIAFNSCLVASVHYERIALWNLSVFRLLKVEQMRSADCVVSQVLPGDLFNK